jgi:hypothetical protein
MLRRALLGVLVCLIACINKEPQIEAAQARFGLLRHRKTKELSLQGMHINFCGVLFKPLKLMKDLLKENRKTDNW